MENSIVEWLKTFMLQEENKWIDYYSHSFWLQLYFVLTSDILTVSLNKKNYEDIKRHNAFFG